MASSSAYSSYQKLANKRGIHVGRQRSSKAKTKKTTNSKGLPYKGFNAEVGF